MRYKSYSADRYIEENSSGKFLDEYDNTSGSINFLAYQGCKAIGSMRACVYDPLKDAKVPAMEIFDKEIQDNLGYNETFVEINKFVIDPSFQRKGGDILVLCLWMLFLGNPLTEELKPFLWLVGWSTSNSIGFWVENLFRMKNHTPI
jgi:hypothetical protein